MLENYRESQGKVLINALTGKVGTSTDMSANATNPKLLTHFEEAEETGATYL